jgi:F0F1-type ATP synthase membrane subunit b/b'
VQGVCREQKGQTLRQMATALINAFLKAKMRDAKASVALYYVSSDVDGAKIVQQMAARTNKAIVEMLESAHETLMKNRNLLLRCSRGQWSESAGDCSNRMLRRRSSTACGRNSASLYVDTWKLLQRELRIRCLRTRFRFMG